MKKIFITILIAFCYSFANLYAQQSAQQTVRNFGDNLQTWCTTNKISYRQNAENLCHSVENKGKKTIVSDDIAFYFARRSQTAINESYELERYLDWYHKEILNKLYVQFSDIRVENNVEPVSYSKYTSRNVEYVSCTITLSGNVDFQEKALFYLLDGKIAKIGRYEVTRTSTGSKVKVDWSDLVDELQTIGGSINYGQNWPIGLSFNYSYSMFMISVDAGVNLDSKDKIYNRKLQMTDALNYTREDTDLDPVCYLTVTPSFFYKYFAVGCGVGAMIFSGTHKTSSYESSSFGTPGGMISGSTSSGLTDEKNVLKTKFMIRPSIKGFIPLSDELYLSLSAGYDMAFGYTKKNGFNFGIGLQYYY